jgi:molecular chaperone HtpG
MQQINDYNDTKFINAIKDDLKLTEEKTDNADNNEICKKIKEILENKVTSVTISSKIESHPVVITSPMGWSANMERIMKAQALNNNPMHSFMMDQKTMEINPNHKLIKKLVELKYDKNYTIMLYNMGLIAGGYELSDSNTFLDSLYNYV